jgi:hypothetical protein
VSARRRSARAAWISIGLFALALGSAVPASAQRQPPRPPRPAPSAGSWELGGGIVWLGGVDFGERAAELTRNPGTGTGPFELFTTGSRLTQGIGLQGRLAVHLAPSMAVEAGVRYTRPQLRISVTGDAEGAPNQVAEETVTQYVFDGSFVYHLTGATFSRGRGVPFVSGGAGYIRDVHDESQLIETGIEYHATGGIKYWFDPRPRPHRFGIRGEVGISIRDGGFDFEDKRRTLPVAGASVIYLF